MASSMCTVLSLLSLVASVSSTSAPGIPSALQNILDNTHKSTQYTYPTDLTRDIIPKPFHSHNDYWRDVPFYSALSHGAISVEADVWLYNDTLYVGHDTSSLTTERTLDSLYINPILDTLRRQNPTSPFVGSTRTRNGVFDTDVGQTLYLFVDIKTSAESAFPVILKYLQPLLTADYLTTWNGSILRHGPVTVIGTGSTTLPLVRSVPGSDSSPRYLFFDAALAELNTTQADVTSHDSPIASGDFADAVGKLPTGAPADPNNLFPPESMERLRGQLAAAHSRGILARYWDLPAFPIWKRNKIWRILNDEGVDLLNVDDLASVAGFWE